MPFGLAFDGALGAAFAGALVALDLLAATAVLAGARFALVGAGRTGAFVVFAGVVARFAVAFGAALEVCLAVVFTVAFLVAETGCLEPPGDLDAPAARLDAAGLAVPATLPLAAPAAADAALGLPATLVVLAAVLFLLSFLSMFVLASVDDWGPQREAVPYHLHPGLQRRD